MRSDLVPVYGTSIAHKVELSRHKDCMMQLCY